jgi:hypothetical protein
VLGAWPPWPWPCEDGPGPGTPHCAEGESAGRPAPLRLNAARIESQSRPSGVPESLAMVASSGVGAVTRRGGVARVRVRVWSRLSVMGSEAGLALGTACARPNR